MDRFLLRKSSKQASSPQSGPSFTNTDSETQSTAYHRLPAVRAVLDIAIVQNSYLYHTRLDIAEYIQPGTLQARMLSPTLLFAQGETAYGRKLDCAASTFDFLRDHTG